jgi:hypothetical protein
MFRATSVSQALELYAKVLVLSRPANVAELFAYFGPFLFVMNFVALALWVLVSSLRPKWAAHHNATFALLCAVNILIFGKLEEGGFVYVAF